MESLQPIRDLFQDPDLRARLEKARSPEEAIGLVVTAGAARQVDFSADSLSKLIEVHASPARQQPSHAELTEVSGYMMGGTHVHMSCCTDCPSGGGLC